MSVLLNCFPFIRSTGKCTDKSQWLAEDVDYGTACAKGREYAAYMTLYLKANPSLAGSNIISQIATDLEFADNSGAKGYRVGFFSFLEIMIYQFGCTHDVCSYLDRINDVYAAAGIVRRKEGRP